MEWGWGEGVRGGDTRQARSDTLGTGSLSCFRALKAVGTDRVGFKLSHRVLLVRPSLCSPPGGQLLDPSFRCSSASCPVTDLSPFLSADLAVCFGALEGRLISDRKLSLSRQVSSGSPRSPQGRSQEPPTCACHGAPEGAAAPVRSPRGSC